MNGVEVLYLDDVIPRQIPIYTAVFCTSQVIEVRTMRHAVGSDTRQRIYVAVDEVAICRLDGIVAAAAEKGTVIRGVDAVVIITGIDIAPV